MRVRLSLSSDTVDNACAMKQQQGCHLGSGLNNGSLHDKRLAKSDSHSTQRLYLGATAAAGVSPEWWRVCLQEVQVGVPAFGQHQGVGAAGGCMP
jgi:hypothetical protein